MKSRSGRLALAGCMLLGALAFAPFSAGAVWDPWVASRIITQNTPESDYSWSNPRIDGSRVVWTQNWVDADVWAYDIRTGSKKRCSTTATGDQANPEISGAWVVYGDSRHGNSEVYAYNLESNEERRITSNSGIDRLPVIAGHRVVYLENGVGLRVYDLSKKTNTVVAPGSGMPYAISSNYLAYVRDNNIHVRDWTSGLDRVIAEYSTSGVSSLSVAGHYVAWTHWNGTNNDVWVRNLNASSSTLIAGGASNQEAPQISGSRLIYVNRTTTGSDIWAYDLIAARRVALVATDATEEQADLSGSNLVWRTGTADVIRLGRISAPVLTISAPSAIGYNTTFKVTGSLVENGVALGGKKVYLDRSTNNGRSWAQIASATTSASGSYSITTPSGLKKASQFRVRYNGSTYLVGMTRYLNGFSALSSAKTVKPKVSLGTPTATSYTKAEDRYFTVRGSLKPRHTSGTKPVQIKVYKKVDGQYVWRKTYTASVYDYDTYSKYKASIKFTSPGRWRVRAYYPTSVTNYKTYSSYRYFTVY